MKTQQSKIVSFFLKRIFFLLALFSSPPAFASHLNGAAVYWSRGATDESGNVTVNFDVYFAFESTSSFNETFYFGDGNSENIANGVYTEVFRGNRPTGLGYYIGKTTLTHVYSAEAITAYGGGFLSGFNTGCRTNGIENFISDSCEIDASAIVDLNTASNLGSANSIPPLAIPAKGGSVLNFTIPFSSLDSDQVKCKLNNDSVINFSVPSIGGSALSVGEDCKLRWDLSAVSAADYGKIFVVQVAFEDKNRPTNYYNGQQESQAASSAGSSSSSPDFEPPAGEMKFGFASGVVDFLVEVVDPAAEIGITCSSDAPAEKIVPPGEQTTFQYNCVANLPQQFIPEESEQDEQGNTPQIQIYTYGGPSNGVFVPQSGASGPSPLNSSFSWNPTDDQRGQQFPLFALFSLVNNSVFNESEDSVRAASNQAESAQLVKSGSPYSYVSLFPTVLKVPLNTPPQCSISGAVETTCKGSSFIATSSITANASDPDGTSLLLGWSVNCPAVLSGKTSLSLPLNTSSLGMSFDVSSLATPATCALTFSANDGLATATCASSVTVKPCGQDCAGVPNGTAVVDRCGVCGGDGQSCLGCTNVQTTASLFALDGNANTAQQLVLRAASLVKKDKTIDRAKRFKLANQLVVQANAAYISAWAGVWSLPQSVSSCSNTNFCVKSSFVSTLSNVDGQLSTFAIQLQEAKVAVKSKSLKKKINKLIKQLNAINSQSFGILGGLPTGNSSCS